MSTPTLSAMSGSSPMVTNSVVPMAKPPRARATSATTVRTVVSGGRSIVGGASVTPPAKTGGLRRIPGCDPVLGRLSGCPSATAGETAQPHQLGGGRCAPRRAGREPLEAGLPHGDVVPGLRQLGIAEQELRTAAAEHGLPQQGADPLAGDGHAWCAGARQHRAGIALQGL